MTEYPRRCLILTQEAIDQAKEAREWYPKQYRNTSQYFELAGNHFYKMLKRRHERKEQA